MGLTSSKEFNKLKQENQDLMKQINELLSKIDQLSEEAQQDKHEFDKVSEFVNSNEIKIDYTDKIAFIGPKGIGKTTFLNIQNICVDKDEKLELPSDGMSDGTCKLNYYSNIIDTVGMNYELHNLLKLLALFLYCGLPSSIVFFCRSHEYKRLRSILSVLFIKSYYICIFSPEIYYDKMIEQNAGAFDLFIPNKMFHSRRKTMNDIACQSAFNKNIYSQIEREQISAKKINVVTVLPNTPLGNLETLNETFNKLFPSGQVNLPTWKQFIMLGSGETTIYKYWICKYLYELKITNKGDVLKFANSIF